MKRLAALLFFGISLNANVVYGSTGMSSATQIESVHVRETFTELHTSGFASPANCANSVRMRLHNNTLNSDKMYAAALTAHAQGKTIQAWVMSCDAEGVANIGTFWIQ